MGAPRPKLNSMRQNMATAHSSSVPALKPYAPAVPGGSVSPKWTIMRMAWISGLKNSWPYSLNSSAWHLRARPRV